jgi:hypothetical protein
MGCNQNVCQPHLLVRSNTCTYYLTCYHGLSLTCLLAHDYHYTYITHMHTQPNSPSIIYVVWMLIGLIESASLQGTLFYLSFHFTT